MLCVVHDGVTYVAPEEIAKRWNCSAKHVQHLIYCGELAGRRFGSILRVRVSDLEKYETAAVVRPAAEAPTPKPPDQIWDLKRQSPERPPKRSKPGKSLVDELRSITPGLLAPLADVPPWNSVAEVRKGIRLLRRPEIAAAIVQWPVIYPRGVTPEQKYNIRAAVRHCSLWIKQLAIPRPIGGRAADDPELLTVLAKLDRMLEQGERKLLNQSA
jgi:hypothetical protein